VRAGFGDDPLKVSGGGGERMGDSMMCDSWGELYAR
jgi:hypothetical protein